MDVQTDGHLRPALLGRLSKSRPKNQDMRILQLQWAWRNNIVYLI